MSDLKSKIQTAIKKNQIGVLSTVNKENKPLGRYMMVKGDEDLNLFCVTFLSSRKIKNIQNNPCVHVTMGLGNQGQPPWIHFAGKAEILSDRDSRHAHWNDMLTQYFKDADDPEYCIIKMSPETIEYWEGMQPEVWTK